LPVVIPGLVIENDYWTSRHLMRHASALGTIPITCTASSLRLACWSIVSTAPAHARKQILQQADLLLDVIDAGPAPVSC